MGPTQKPECSMPVYQAIIFDFGGVITTSPFEAFNRLEAERGLPRDFVRHVNATNPNTNAWARFERAEIDPATFDLAFSEEAKLCGGDLSGREVIACLSGNVRPAIVGALDQLVAGGFSLGCITNNVPSGQGAGMADTAHKAEAVAAILDRFDHVIESSKVGLRKPDPRIYEMMCEMLGISAKNCIYLDDLGINCKPAAALGMAAIKVESGEQALHDLGALLNMRFA
jgi:putative hydrolase of the HAD superfamily